MILIDTNLLIYAHDDASPFHDRAKEWLHSVLSGTTAVRLTWSTIHGFLRLTTQRALFRTPFTPDEATEIVASWFGQSVVRILDPGDLYWLILRDLLSHHNVRSSLVMDAHLAAIAIEHGATLYTADRDFNRFEGLQVRNPLTEG